MTSEARTSHWLPEDAGFSGIPWGMISICDLGERRGKSVVRFTGTDLSKDMMLVRGPVLSTC
jgi:hypothetical protein